MSLFGGFATTPQVVARIVPDRSAMLAGAAVGAHPGAEPARNAPAEPSFLRVALPVGLRAVPVIACRGTLSAAVDTEPYGGVDACTRKALDGLRTLPRPAHRVLGAGTTGRVECFVADDVLGASRLLVLDELLAEVLHLERPSYGTLVVVPNRHVMAVHVLDSLAGVPAAMNLLSELALVEHRIADPLSPWLYYRAPDATMTTVTEPGGAGLATAFHDALTRMAPATR